jgi:hypothetical protein
MRVRKLRNPRASLKRPSISEAAYSSGHRKVAGCLN